MDIWTFQNTYESVLLEIFPEVEWISWCSLSLLLILILLFTVVQNSQELGRRYWDTCSSVCLFACTANSFACFTPLAWLTRSAVLIHLLARPLTAELMGKWMIRCPKTTGFDPTVLSDFLSNWITRKSITNINRSFKRRILFGRVLLERVYRILPNLSPGASFKLKFNIIILPP